MRSCSLSFRRNSRDCLRKWRRWASIDNPTVQKVSAFRFPYSECELLANMTPEKSHADESASPTETELGI